MTAAFELPTLTDSPLRTIDPRWKVGSATLLALAVLAIHGLGPLAFAVVCTCVLVWFARLPWRWYRNRVIGLAVLWIGLFATLPFFIPATTHYAQIGHLRVSEDGFVAAARVSTKALAILNLALIVVGTTPFPVLLQMFSALKLPSIVIQLLSLTFRFLFLFGDELRRIRIALRVRGYRNQMALHSYRTAGHVAGTMLVRAIERVERVGQAMRCRGYSGRFYGSGSFHTTAKDIVFFLAILATTAVMVTWDRIAIWV